MFCVYKDIMRSSGNPLTITKKLHRLPFRQETNKKETLKSVVQPEANNFRERHRNSERNEAKMY